MPVPTPRTIQPTESSCLDGIQVENPQIHLQHGQVVQPQSIATDESIEDNIPEDWKDNGEIVIKHLQPTCQITTNLQESVKPWTQPIPEVSEEEISETEETEIGIYMQNNNNSTQKHG